MNNSRNKACIDIETKPTKHMKSSSEELQKTHNFKKDEDFILEKNYQKQGQDTYIFDPYNPLNIEITEKDIQTLLKIYGLSIPIHHFTLYKRAFIHKSYIKRPILINEQNNVKIVPKPDNCYSLYTKSNERLEFLGDGVLECIAKFYLYKRFPKADEGFMTDTKIELVKNETIGRIAMEMGLHKWFMLSKNTETKNIRTNLKKLGCLFEAFVGALFLDFNRISINDEDNWFSEVFSCGPGFQIAQVFIESVFDKHIDWTKMLKNTENYKRPLQELLQMEFKVTPYPMEIIPYSLEKGYNMGIYLCMGQPTHGITHSQTLSFRAFTSFSDIHRYMAVHHRIFVFLGEGTHRIKQTAEQMACRNAIDNLKQTFTDFSEIIEKIQQKYNVFTDIHETIF
jgi:dsRNA-specific ribonuclease